MDTMQKQLNNAYWERNQLIVALSKLFPSHLAKHPESDKEWEDDWRTIVVILLPPHTFLPLKEGECYSAENYMPGIYSNQLTWHIHDSEIGYFDHLDYADYEYDGHSTEEKYRRLRKIHPLNIIKKKLQFAP